ncbi:MAG: hypothetical protein ACYS18_10050 [Planctomycetota bacterium]|jgi:hypothetical protein
MKKLKIATVAVLVVLAGRMALAFDAGQWKYRADIIIVDYETEYLKVELTPEVYDAARADLGDIRLINAKGEQVPYILSKPRDIVEGVEPRPLTMKLAEHSEDEENNMSVYVYDFGYYHLPVNEIELEVADDSFQRYVTILGRDAATKKVGIDSEDNRQRFKEVEASFKQITSGKIYRYTTAEGEIEENLTLHIRPGLHAYKHLKLTIRNYDDKPLTVLSATARIIPHNIFFALAEARTDTLADDVVTLYVGCESATMPRYDLRHRLTDTTKIEAGETILGKIAENQQAEFKKPVAWTEKHKALLAIILIVVVVVLAGFIFKSFKAIQTEQPQN